MSQANNPTSPMKTRSASGRTRFGLMKGCPTGGRKNTGSAPAGSSKRRPGPKPNWTNSSPKTTKTTTTKIKTTTTTSTNIKTKTRLTRPFRPRPGSIRLERENCDDDCGVEQGGCGVG